MHSVRNDDTGIIVVDIIVTPSQETIIVDEDTLQDTRGHATDRGQPRHRLMNLCVHACMHACVSERVREIESVCV